MLSTWDEAPVESIQKKQPSSLVRSRLPLLFTSSTTPVAVCQGIRCRRIVVRQLLQSSPIGTLGRYLHLAAFRTLARLVLFSGITGTGITFLLMILEARSDQRTQITVYGRCYNRRCLHRRVCSAR